MNIECPHFSILQDIVTSHVCQSITVLTVAHQAPRGLAVLFDIKKNYEVQDVAERAKTHQQNIRVLHMCLHAEMHIIIKENKSTCTCLTEVYTSKEIQRKS